MLRTLVLDSFRPSYHDNIPAALQPLIDTAVQGLDIVPAVTSVTRSFGFDAFNCSVSMSLRPVGESVSYVFTTMPPEWVAIYDQRAYVEVDPRIQSILRARLPIIWDQKSFRGQSAKIDEFLNTGLHYGLGSGIALGFVNSKGHGVLFALNSKADVLTAARRADIFNASGDIMLFAHFFYEMFVSNIIDRSIPPMSQGAPLSPREKECVSLAAHGLKGDDIAHELGIAPRTVQFHFDSIRSKLGATTRQEAVAKAVQAGIVTGLT
jgi:DNA-binding CsgD family transcriptional regulator